MTKVDCDSDPGRPDRAAVECVVCGAVGGLVLDGDTFRCSDPMLCRFRVVRGEEWVRRVREWVEG